MTRQDPLIGHQVRVLQSATTLRGKPLPEAGQIGTIKSRTPGGRQYQVVMGAGLINLPLDAFEVLDAQAPAPDDDQSLSLDECAPSRTNRAVVEDEDLRDLAATIKLYGVLQPILVRKLPPERLQDTFENAETRRATHEIIAGERRWRAARLAGLRRIPVLRKDVAAPEALLMQLVENLHRTDLNPLDEARGIQRLIEEHGYTRESAAEAVRKSRTHVYESQRLLALCPEAQAAMRAGTLKRSVALLVAQRPTMALQQEFTRRVLTGGPDNGPMSYRSAADLARRNYMTDLAQAPFALDDASLFPAAGACTTCAKRTGASPELWDKSGVDVCTDVSCFADKKEAHNARLMQQARERGRTVITGSQAREIMPTDSATPAGYLLLDKTRKGDTEPLRALLGQSMQPEKVVLIEAPSGALVEAVPVQAASRALEAKAPPKNKPGQRLSAEPTREVLETEYQLRWRRAAISAVVEHMHDQAPMEVPPSIVLQTTAELIAHDTDEDSLQAIFGRPMSRDSLALAIEERLQRGISAYLDLMLMLAAAVDVTPEFGRPVNEARHLEAIAPTIGLDLAAIKASVQADMKAEAAERAAARQPQQPDTAKPTRKAKADKPPKTTKAQASAAIAQAMNAAEAPNGFSVGDRVLVRIDLKNAKGRLVPTKGLEATITGKAGDRAWMLDVDKLNQGADLVADYTELEALS